MLIFSKYLIYIINFINKFYKNNKLLILKICLNKNFAYVIYNNFL